MSTAETIYELVKTLPDEKVNLVLAFTEFVQQQDTWLRPVGEERDTLSWAALIDELSGAWPDFPTAEELRNTFERDVVREVL